ncbi:Zn-ribbon domain-containing OB-fold protein [Streptomyces sp. bgisy027]|uniref:Zn-ribbon domain-containing OB-fold protein n=1 Tax=unclassified Streptomyces TaxID=2593676 RepID=UPI003D72DCE1
MTAASVRIADGARTPLPRLSADTAFFWQSGADGLMRIQRCAECGRYAHPPTPECRTCGAFAPHPVPVSGRATVFSFTVNHQTFVPWLPAPYILAIVALDEQPDIHLTTRLVDVDPENVRIGMRVAVVFERHGEVYLPLFAPAGEAGADAGAH